MSSVDSFRQCQSDGDIYLAGGPPAGGRPGVDGRPGWLQRAGRGGDRVAGGWSQGEGRSYLGVISHTRGSFEASKRPIATSNESFVYV